MPFNCALISSNIGLAITDTRSSAETLLRNGLSSHLSVGSSCHACTMAFEYLAKASSRVGSGCGATATGNSRRGDSLHPQASNPVMRRQARNAWMQPPDREPNTTDHGAFSPNRSLGTLRMDSPLEAHKHDRRDDTNKHCEKQC